MKPHRGHYRPLFNVGVGRSPSFLVAALFIGLCILAFSYWRLALQYHDLEEQMKRLIQKRDSLEANQNFINKQLEIREENFSEAKVSLQKKEQELDDLKKKSLQTDKELADIRISLDQIKRTNDKLKSETKDKELQLKQLNEQSKVLKTENLELKNQIKELKTKNLTLLHENPVVKLLTNNVSNSIGANSPKSTNQNNQIQAPPSPLKQSDSEPKVAIAAESRVNANIVDPANMMDDTDSEKDQVPMKMDRADDQAQSPIRNDLEIVNEKSISGKNRPSNSINSYDIVDRKNSKIGNGNLSDNLIDSNLFDLILICAIPGSSI